MIAPQNCPLPWCGSHRVQVIDCREWRDAVFVHCLACGLDGPEGETEREAVTVWNGTRAAALAALAELDGEMIGEAA